MALLSEAPRAATVKAVRDSELLRLPKAGFDEFSAAHPEVMLRLARAIVGRLRRTQGGHASRHRDRMIALLPAAPDVPLAAFAAALRRELAPHLTSALLDGSASARAGASGVEDPEVVLLVCDATLTAWTSQCLRQADDLVVVGKATADPVPGALEQEALAAVARREARCHLVLLHDTDRAPRGTAAWLSARPGVRHHHVRAASGADHARLARHLSDRATGLALSGGGARGFAHIGVLRALEEARVPIDLVAGTSMGAMIAAVHALGYGAGEMLDRCRLWTKQRPWTDATLPIASISGGRRVRRANAALFGDARIEDAWLPFACVTSNLTRATADVHSAGPLSLLVLASNSAPGLAPPVFYRDEVHVDGGLMDNLPLGVLRRMGAGRVIAVDVGTEIRVDAPSGVEECPGGWGLLWDRVRRRPRRAPPVHLTLTKAFTLASEERSQAACREADLTIRPALGDYASSDFGDIDAIEALGYESARSALAGAAIVEGTRR
jgi:predicted acylesterase/phospholipase RssA